MASEAKLLTLLSLSPPKPLEFFFFLRLTRVFILVLFQAPRTKVNMTASLYHAALL